MATVTQTLTVDEYIELERTTGERHEFRNGEAIPTVGGSGNHSLIITNLVVAMTGHARNPGRQTHGSDMRVAVPSTDAMVYPDVVVTDGLPNYVPPKDTLTNPRLVVEVLSPSTEAYDRDEKFDDDCTIDGFREYLLVSQEKPNVTQFVNRDGNWLRFTHADSNSTIDIESLNCQIALVDIYDQVDFTASGNTTRPST